MKYGLALISFLFYVISVAADDLPTPEPAPVAAEVTEPWESNALLQNVNITQLRDLRALRQEVRSRGCTVNVCFAMQGDNFLSTRQFNSQKNFIELMVSLTATDRRGHFCAVQYSRTTSPISSLTRRKIRFLNKVQNSRRNGLNDTNISAALAYSGFQLRTRRNQPRKIILFGDGFDNAGPDPIGIAAEVRSEGTEICAVAVGDLRRTRDLVDIVGAPERVFQINEYLDLGEIVHAIVNNVCGLQN